MYIYYILLGNVVKSGSYCVLLCSVALQAQVRRIIARGGGDGQTEAQARGAHH